MGTHSLDLLEEGPGGGTGFTTTPIGPFSAAQALALGPDNRIVAAGYTCNGTCEFAVARYLAN